MEYVHAGPVERLLGAGADPAARSYLRLPVARSCEAWLIRWPAGSCAPLHDHGGARGVAAMVRGTLREWRTELGLVRSAKRAWRYGDSIELAVGTCHEVHNLQRQTAYSIHVYEPRLERMTFYDRTLAGDLRPLRQEGASQW
jgi:predicted metal-dependent enzyme (double-stranded beta helix superfamily)